MYLSYSRNWQDTLNLFSNQASEIRVWLKYNEILKIPTVTMLLVSLVCSLDSMWVRSYGTFLSLTGLFHLAWCSPGQFMLSQRVKFSSFIGWGVFLSGTLCKCTTGLGMGVLRGMEWSSKKERELLDTHMSVVIVGGVGGWIEVEEDNGG